MKLAKVVRVYPESNKVDLLVLDDGRRLPGVSVMAAGPVSSSSGVSGLPTPDSQDLPDPYEAPTFSKRDIVAVVGFYEYLPIVMGFLFPEVSECLFADKDRYMNRTPSDLYWTVDGLGNAELFHPSGAYVRIATNSAHEDLKGKDFDKVFNPARNADKKVHFHIAQAGGKASVDIAPSGAISVQSKSTLSMNAAGAVSITSGAGITLTAPTINLNS